MTVQVPDRQPLLLAMALAAVLILMLPAVACGGGNQRTAPTGISATATGSPPASTTPAPASPATPVSPPATAVPAPSPGVVAAPSTVDLVEAATGRSSRVFQSMTHWAWNVRWDGDEFVVFAGNRAGAANQRFGLDGSLRPGGPRVDCRDGYWGAEIGGRLYAGARCSDISPDGRWLTYRLDAGEYTLPSGHAVSTWDQWVVDLATGAAGELQTGLIHCGGCDSRWTTSWSPDSRHLAFAELAHEQRTWLANLETGETRPLGHGADLGDRPSWSPDGTRIAYRVAAHPDARARVDHLATGQSHELPVPWPVAFDPSGRLLYSLSFGWSSKVGGAETTLVDVATNRVVATLAGAAPYLEVFGGSPAAVAATGSGFVAALQGREACDGTAIYVDGPALALCVDDGAGAAVAPGGKFVAVARESGTSGPVTGPAFDAAEMALYAVDIFDVGAGTVTTVAQAAPGFAPPLLRWNAAGTHLLVLSPRSVGL